MSELFQKARERLVSGNSVSQGRFKELSSKYMQSKPEQANSFDATKVKGCLLYTSRCV